MRFDDLTEADKATQVSKSRCAAGKSWRKEMPLTKEQIEEALVLRAKCNEWQTRHAVTFAIYEDERQQLKAARQEIEKLRQALLDAKARIAEAETELATHRERLHRHDGPLDFVAEV